MNRIRAWRWLAARRAAKRRGSERASPPHPDLRHEPLPPLVLPDDDREFLETRQTPAPALKTAC
jgi:hypothetical protein